VEGISAVAKSRDSCAYSSPPMGLVIILGAGASYDSVDVDQVTASRFGELTRYRPPLAKDLFEPREWYGSIVDSFPDCRPAVHELRLRIRRGENVETALATMKVEAETYPDRGRHLAAIRFYLRMLLDMSTQKWSAMSNGITNYLSLVDRVNRWTFETGHDATFITFNYDTLLEHAVQDVTGKSFATFESYVDSPRIRVVKLHGSTNWAHLVNPPREDSIGADPNWLINRHAGLSDSGRWQISENWTNLVYTEEGHGPLLRHPAISVPVESKDEFECPPEQMEVAERALRKATSILVIGWRAADCEFLDRWAAWMANEEAMVNRGEIRPPLKAVSGSADGAAAVNKQLLLWEPKGLKLKILPESGGGFTGLITAGFEDFLADD
jgi:hypothetical protein